MQLFAPIKTGVRSGVFSDNQIRAFSIRESHCIRSGLSASIYAAVSCGLEVDNTSESEKDRMPVGPAIRTGEGLKASADLLFSKRSSTLH